MPVPGSTHILAAHFCMNKEVDKYPMTSFHYAEQAYNRKGYWINELQSLGITSKKINDYLDNGNNNEEEASIRELADLVENITQTMYQEYKTAYSERMSELEDVEGGGEQYILSP